MKGCSHVDAEREALQDTPGHGEEGTLRLRLPGERVER